MLTKNDALMIMEKMHGRKRVPFSISYITANRDQWAKKKKLIAEHSRLSKRSKRYRELSVEIETIDAGGRLITVPNAILSGARGVSGARRKKEIELMISGGSKNPRHWHNRTRNIKVLPSGELRKVHIGLIMMINNQEVLY